MDSPVLSYKRQSSYKSLLVSLPLTLSVWFVLRHRHSTRSSDTCWRLTSLQSGGSLQRLVSPSSSFGSYPPTADPNHQGVGRSNTQRDMYRQRGVWRQLTDSPPCFHHHAAHIERHLGGFIESLLVHRLDRLSTHPHNYRDPQSFLGRTTFFDLRTALVDLDHTRHPHLA